MDLNQYMKNTRLFGYMSDIFLKAYHSGLGDNLQFSTLPEQFSKQHGKKTYILESASFRNEEIYDLIWGKNPYVEGKKEGPWNAGDTPEFRYSTLTGNMIKNLEKLHGLEPINTHPKIYYEPEKCRDMENIFIVDFSCISIDYDKNELNNVLEKLKINYFDKKFVSVCFTKQIFDGKYNKYHAGFDGYIQVENIFRYCDLISSAYGLVALSSGASHLSSAIKEYSPNLKSICIMPQKWYNIHKERELFLFDNVDYLTY